MSSDEDNPKPVSKGTKANLNASTESTGFVVSEETSRRKGKPLKGKINEDNSDDECLAVKKQQKRKKAQSSSSGEEPLVAVLKKSQPKKKKVDENGYSGNKRRSSKSVAKQTAAEKSSSEDEPLISASAKTEAKVESDLDSSNEDLQKFRESSNKTKKQSDTKKQSVSSKSGPKNKKGSSTSAKKKEDSSSDDEVLQKPLVKAKSSKDATAKSKIKKKSAKIDAISDHSDSADSSERLSSIKKSASRENPSDDESDAQQKSDSDDDDSLDQRRRAQKSSTKTTKKNSKSKKSQGQKPTKKQTAASSAKSKKSDDASNKPGKSSPSSLSSDSDSDDSIGRKLKIAEADSFTKSPEKSESVLNISEEASTSKPVTATAVESSSDTSVYDSEAEGAKRKSPVKKRRKSKGNTEENGGNGDASEEQLKKGKVVSTKAEGEHPRISKLKKFIRLAGLRCIYKQLFEDCPNDDAKIKKLEEFCESKGLCGPLTIEVCKQFKLKNEEKKELAALDVRNIISDERMTRRSAPKNLIRKNYEESDSVSSSDHELKEKECKSVFARLKDIVDDGEDSD